MADLSSWVSVTPVIVATFALGVREPAIIASMLVVVTSIMSMTPKVRQLIKRNYGDNSSTPIEEGSHSRDHLTEDVG